MRVVMINLTGHMWPEKRVYVEIGFASEAGAKPECLAVGFG